MKPSSHIMKTNTTNQVAYRRRNTSNNSLSGDNHDNYHDGKITPLKEACLNNLQQTPQRNNSSTRRLSWKHCMLIVASILWFPICWITIYLRYNIHDNRSPSIKSSQPSHKLRKNESNYSIVEKELDSQTFLKYVETIRTPLPLNKVSKRDLTYDIYNCPKEQPENYPMEWPLVEQVLDHWNPSSPHVPSDGIYQSLCVFTDKEKARIYQKAEKPFILRDDPTILPTVHRWNHNHPHYLIELLGRTPTYHVETSASQHLMWFKERGRGDNTSSDWKPPMENKQMTYLQWLNKANVTLDYSAKDPHYYFRVNAKKPGHFLYDELPWFDATSNRYDPFYMVNPSDARGINCRFGMVGNMAESHYDSSRNFIVLLGGQRRYLLSHPKNCHLLELYPMGHPSARHSGVDWTLPADTIAQQYPTTMKQATANEVVLQAGDVLYLPTFWFHTIISLNLNYQCNARSGSTDENLKHIRKCGFI